jgi:hypothetical protein
MQEVTKTMEGMEGLSEGTFIVSIEGMYEGTMAVGITKAIPPLIQELRSNRQKLMKTQKLIQAMNIIYHSQPTTT